MTLETQAAPQAPRTVNNAGDAFLDAKMDGDRDGTLSVSGSKAPSFDDFDNVVKTREDFTKARKSVTKIPGGNDGLRKEKSSEKTNEEIEVKNSSDGVSKKEEKESDKSGVDESKDLKTPDESKVKKTIKALDGENNLDLNPSVKIPVKIEGKVQQVELQELLNNYSGKVVYDKKFNELSKSKKAWESERETIFSHFKTMRDHMQNNKPVDAFGYLVDILGGDRHNFIKTMREALAPEVINLYNMTDEERQAYESKTEAEALRSKLQSLEAEKIRLREASELRAKQESIKRSLGIDDETYESVIEELNGMGHENAAPEFIGEYIRAKNAYGKIEQMAKAINPSLVADVDFIDEVVKLSMEHTDLNDEDLEYIIREATGHKKELQTLTDKSSSTQIAMPHKKQTTTGKPEFFSDYED